MAFILPNLDFSQLKQNSLVLLAEGNSETGFLYKLATHHHLVDAVVGNVQGERRLGTALRSLAPYRSRLRALGLMFDANSDSIARLTSISDVLNNAGFSYNPNQVGLDGIFRGQLDIGVFLSPGGQRSGRIENLVLDEIRTKSLWHCLEQLTACTQKVPGLVGYDEKSMVQIAISTLEGGVCGVGTAFKRGLLDVSHPAYQVVSAMITGL